MIGCLGCFLFQYQVVLMDFMKRKHKKNTRVFNVKFNFMIYFQEIRFILFDLIVRSTHLHSSV